MKTLERMMVELQNGSLDSLEAIYKTTSRGVFAFILPILKDYALSEDVLQETYLKVYKNIKSYDPNQSAINWILTIAKNTALNEIKHQTREVSTDIEQCDYYSGAYTLDKSLDTPTINLANKILSKEEFDIVILFVVGEYKHREIAEMLNLPLGTVTWKYNNALKKIKKALEEENEKEKHRKTVEE